MDGNASAIHIPGAQWLISAQPANAPCLYIIPELQHTALEIRLSRGFSAVTDIHSLGKINVYWDSSKRLLEVRDNGTGMSQQIIENHLLKVGASRYQDPQFKDEHPAFSSISRFGIGVLSMFMVADQIEITTCHADEDEARHLSLRTVHGNYLIKATSKNDPFGMKLGV